MSRTRRWTWVCLLVAAAVAWPCLSTITRGHVTAYRLESLLKQTPTVEELKAFITKHELRTPLANDQNIGVWIDVFGLLPTEKRYSIRIGPDGRVTDYTVEEMQYNL